MDAKIDLAFSEMIATYRCHVKLGLTANHVRVLRWQLRQGKHISVDKKQRLLKKWGWKPEAHRWQDKDLIDVIKFTIKTGTSGKKLGAGYILEKWLQNR